jgi:hypothetical protein
VAGGSANALNQYTTITQPQSFDVTGTRANGNTTMAVNGTTPAYQQDTTYGLYWRADVSHNAGVHTRYTPVNVTADITTTDSWLQYVPPASEPLAYDDDGNLTSDGRWFYKWDGENRLVRMDSVAQTNPTVKSMRLIFTYDGLSRRIRKDVYQDSPAHTVISTHGTLTKREHYVYEGWNLILTAADNGVGTPGSNSGGNITRRVASYVWGPQCKIPAILKKTPCFPNHLVGCLDHERRQTHLSNSRIFGWGMAYILQNPGSKAFTVP